MKLRFHWRMIHAGESDGVPRGTQDQSAEMGRPDLAYQADFCRRALACGIESLLLNIGFAKPDPLVLATALGLAVDDIRFIIAYRSGLMSPVTFVQQLNTLSGLIQGRFTLNIVAGHSPDEQRSYGDFLEHDLRYERTDEFLAICHAFWRGEKNVNFEGRHYRVQNGNLTTPFVADGRRSPEIYIAGNSGPAERLALARGDCWMQLADTPENIGRAAARVLDKGIEVGVRASLIARPTHDEAVAAAYELVGRYTPEGQVRRVEAGFIQKSDSVTMHDLYRRAEQDWLTPTLFAGTVRTHGAAAIALVGSPEELAATFLDYKRAGVSQFILAGWPKVESMEFFGSHVLPLVRALERAEDEAAATDRPGLPGRSPPIG